MSRIFVILLIVHIFGDFVLQNQEMCKGKFDDGWNGTQLFVHTVIIFILTASVVLLPHCWLIGLTVLVLMSAEYAFQSIKTKKIEKSDELFKKCEHFMNSYHVHELVLIVIMVIAFVMQVKYGLVVMFITVTHFLIDGIKSIIENKKINGNEIHNSGYELYTFSLDQLLHVLVLYCCAIWLNKMGWTEPVYLNGLSLRTLVFILMFFVCGAPANILTRRILVFLNIDKREEESKEGTQDEDDVYEEKIDGYNYIITEKPPKTIDKNKRELLEKNKEDNKTGRVIGLIERRLIIFFMFIQQFAAIGFIITAKSILRFKDIKPGDSVDKNPSTDTETKSEYVLIGTFVSISIAVTCGFIILAVGNPSLLTSEHVNQAICICKKLFGH